MNEAEKNIREVTEFIFDNRYCPECSHCGILECCGIENFLDTHVKGKTDCLHEEEIIEELKQIIKEWKNK